MIDHTAPARADREEALAVRAWLYVAQIEARCVDLGPESLRAIEICRRLEGRTQKKEINPGAITGIRKAEAPCADCIDGWCQMNCGPRVG